ncbi:MAG TPA: formimidoylglutamate deiminase, partial [Rhodanobacteraceae bacterium]|nr:formimidoylglutamate deiminase [Rhodanobacteraceae bacterium]
MTRDAARGDAEFLGRWVMPGMPNLHSHAFQRAMAGLAERQTNPDDSFWTWREIMYRFASRIGPDELHAIAAQLYVEMLKAGYTRVCEFHYLHRQPDGTPYDDPAAMSLALVEAAREAGIGLTLLPALYMTGGFDRRALSERQRRFGLGIDDYLGLVERLRALESPGLRVGIAFHSLRAVPEDAMRAVLDAAERMKDAPAPGAWKQERTDPEVAGPSPPSRSQRERDSLPIHIHIAEQIGEVQDCLAMRNARPVEWLLDRLPVDRRWCLVHATHLTLEELRRLAASGAVAGLCPTTEANLGDGIFALKPWLDAGGAIGIGSDSHISVSPVEELRWLEYGQRLSLRHRNIAAATPGASVGETLWARALAGGARSAGVPAGLFDAEAQADADGAAGVEPGLEGEDAVAEIRLGGGTQAGHRAACRKAPQFLQREVGRMH